MTGVLVETTQEPLEELVTQAQQGSRQAFEQLMSRTQGLARKTAFPLVLPHQVDDVVQDSFLIVYQKLHHLQKPEAFQAWLSRIVIHAAHALRKKQPPVKDAPDELPGGDDTRGVALKLDLRAALQKLSEDDRQVLVLREFLKFSYEEVAYVTRLPLGTVRSKLHYGRKKLQELLKPE